MWEHPSYMSADTTFRYTCKYPTPYTSSNLANINSVIKVINPMKLTFSSSFLRLSIAIPLTQAVAAARHCATGALQLRRLLWKLRQRRLAAGMAWTPRRLGSKCWGNADLCVYEYIYIYI